MAKDPAFLFYPGDYLRDTQCLSESVQVAYDRIICEHMRNICIRQDQLNFFTKRLNQDQKNELMMVLEKTPDGYRIPWVAESILNRRSYSESRRKNRTAKPKNISSTYDSHMENANEIVNENINRNKNEKFGKSENLFNPSLISQMQDIWKKTFPNYTHDKESDFPACKKIADFIFRNAGVKNGYGDNDAEIKVLNTFQLIADNVATETFWTNKPLSSIAHNIQEFYNKIKNPINGNKPKQGLDDNKLRQKLSERDPSRK